MSSQPAQSGTIKVLVIRSLSYTGTTWVNAVLAGCGNALLVGAPQRVWQLTVDQAPLACRVHRRECNFWPQFVRSWNRQGGFFAQLQRFSGHDLFVINNPTLDFARTEIERPEVEPYYLKLARDGRAVLTSFLRHQPERHTSVYDAVQQWLFPALNRLETVFHRLEAPKIAMRYEDFALDLASASASVASFLGVDPPAEPAEWWRGQPHLTSGNQGMIYLARRFQGLSELPIRRLRYYRELYRQLERGDGMQVTPDESWRQLLGERDLFIYDYICGQLHQELGYEREVPSPERRRQFLDELGLPDQPEDRPESLGRTESMARFKRGLKGRTLRSSLRQAWNRIRTR